jgi:hypothetical protein
MCNCHCAACRNATSNKCAGQYEVSKRALPSRRLLYADPRVVDIPAKCFTQPARIHYLGVVFGIENDRSDGRSSKKQKEIMGPQRTGIKVKKGKERPFSQELSAENLSQIKKL